MKGVRFCAWAFGFMVLVLASGCATTSKSANQENENLKIQIQNLETQMRQKDAEIDSLRQSLSRTTEEKYAKSRITPAQSVTEQPTVKQVQAALKNAGFDPGSVDGQMGRKTRQAVRDFQKANNLSVDGKVGKKTWAVLSAYLER